MNETIVTLDPLQDERWDRFVERHPFGWLCHLAGWKRVLETSFSHLRGHYLAATRDGAITSGLPLYEVRSRLTGDRLVSIPFATLADPLVSSAEDMDRLLAATMDLAARLKIDTLEIRTLAACGFLQDKRLGRTDFYKHHYLALDRPLDVISRGFHRSCVRQRITRATNSGIAIAEGSGETDLREFNRLYLMSRKRLGLPPQPYCFLRSLWDTFHPAKQLTLLTAAKDGLCIGGLILFKFKDRVSAEFAVYDHRFLNLSPLHGMFWEAIRMAHREGYRIFDFGRTSPNNQTLMEFKGRWGAAVVDLPNFYHPPELCTRDADKDGSLSRRLIRAFCRAAPETVNKGLGKFLYRHMS